MSARRTPPQPSMYTRHEHEVILDYAEKRAQLLSNTKFVYGGVVGFVVGVSCTTAALYYAIWAIS